MKEEFRQNKQKLNSQKQVTKPDASKKNLYYRTQKNNNTLIGIVVIGKKTIKNNICC